MTMKAHTYYIIFGRPPIGGSFPLPPLAAPLSCLLVWIRRISQIPYRWGPRHTQWCNHSLSQVSSNHRHAHARRPIFNLLLFSGLTMVLSTCGQKLWSAPSYRPIFLGCHTGHEGRPKSLFYSRNSRTLCAAVRLPKEVGNRNGKVWPLLAL